MVRNKTAKEKLTEILPTMESMVKAKELYISWAQMARSIGISKQSLYDYREFLGMMKEKGGKKTKNFCMATNLETDALVKQLAQGESKNIVTKYKITDPALFFANPCGNKGLEYIGTEQGTSWGALNHCVSAIGGRGQ